MSKQDMENLDSNEKSDHNLISMETLEDILDRSQTHLSINKRESRCKIRDCIKQRQSEWKGALKATRNMGKFLHKVFSMVVKDIWLELIPLGESGSELSHFIPEQRNFAELAKLSENIQKPWLKATIKEKNNLVNNQTFLIYDQNEGDPVTPCMDVYKSSFKSDGSLDKWGYKRSVK